MERNTLEEALMKRLARPSMLLAVFVLTIAAVSTFWYFAVVPMAHKIETQGLKSIAQAIWEGSGE